MEVVGVLMHCQNERWIAKTTNSIFRHIGGEGVGAVTMSQKQRVSGKVEVGSKAV